MKCSKCGGTIPGNYHYCDYCGAPVGPSAQANMVSTPNQPNTTSGQSTQKRGISGCWVIFIVLAIAGIVIALLSVATSSSSKISAPSAKPPSTSTPTASAPITTTPARIPIQYGQEVAGIITLSALYQDWQFTGKQGEMISMLIVQDGGASLNPGVDLRDPSGSRVAVGESVTKTGHDRGIQNYTLRFSGIYTIRAYIYSVKTLYGPTMDDTGGYKLSLALKSPPGSLAYGQEATGVITLLDNYQDWTFNGQQADTISISILRNGWGILNPGIDLRDPNGNWVTEGSVKNNNYTERHIENFPLRLSGIYNIHVHVHSVYSLNGCGDECSGGYRLSLKRK